MRVRRRLATVALACALVVGLAAALAATGRPPAAAQDPAPAPRGVGPVVWSDEFRGPRGRRPDPRRWEAEIGGRWGQQEVQSYTARARNASLDGRGNLVITAREERYTGADGVTRDHTSARLVTRDRLEFAYGRVEARMRVPSGGGLVSAFWALGRDVDAIGWPAAGEIDVMEVLGSRPREVLGSLHGPGRDDRYALVAERGTSVPLSAGFHTYRVDWSPSEITWSIDGRPYAVRRPGDLAPGQRWVFDRPFFLLLTLAVGGRWAGPPAQDVRWPARLVVDWVRVRSLGGRTVCSQVADPRLRDRCPAP